MLGLAFHRVLIGTSPSWYGAEGDYDWASNRSLMC
jgi:hypothetical protein